MAAGKRSSDKRKRRRGLHTVAALACKPKKARCGPVEADYRRAINGKGAQPSPTMTDSVHLNIGGGGDSVDSNRDVPFVGLHVAWIDERLVCRR